MSQGKIKRYWFHEGTYQAAVESLQKLIPVEGEVDNPAKNKALEKLRKAINCYYDLYNNGLCNRATQFRAMFGFGGKEIALNGFADCPKMLQLEEKMDAFVINAAKEQGITIREFQ